MSNNKKVIILKELKEVMEKRNSLKQKFLESQPGYGIRKLLEGELERAELILASKDLVNRLQDMAEKTAKMQIEDVMPLVDNMKGEFSAEQAEQFDQSATQALTAALEGLKSAREAVNNQVLQMQGKLSDEDSAALQNDMGGEEEIQPDAGGDMAGDPELDLGGDEELNLGDEGDMFGGADGNRGGDQPLGRARKESAVPKGKKLSESKKKSR